MRIKAISDLHIGDMTAADDFEIDELLFVEYLEKNCEQFDKLVLCGDVFECWQSTEWEIQRTSFLKILELRPSLSYFLINKIQSQQIIYVTGNHDAIVLLKNLLPGALERYTVMEHGVKILFAHGHQADIFNSTFNEVGHLFSKAMGWLQRNVYQNIDHEIRGLQRFLPGRHANPSLFFEHAKEQALRERFQIVVYGHTHRPIIQHCNDPQMTYCNTGKVCDNRNTNWDELILEIYEDGTYHTHLAKADVLDL